MADEIAAEMSTGEHAEAEARRNAYARVPFTRMMGVQRGGVILTMLDVVMASAAVSLVDFTKTAVTLNLNTSFLRPGLGRIVADGFALETNDGVISCSAEARDASGELVATALGTFRYLPLPPSES